MATRGDGARMATSVKLNLPPPTSAPAALGSLAPWDFHPGAAYAPEARDKGLRFWAGTSYQWERAAPAGGRDFGHYRQQGWTQRLGVDYDLSANIIVKASLEHSRRRFSSLRADDRRTSRVDGLVLGASVDWLVDERFVFSAAAFYGWAGIKSGGELSFQGMSGMSADWSEETRRSGIQGFSGTLSFPPLFDQGFKLSPTLGWEFSRVANPVRRGRLSAGGQALMNPDLESPAWTSTSLRLPATLRIGRDFRKNWGLLAPRLDLGLLFALGNSGAAARDFGADSLAAFSYAGDYGLGHLPVGFKKSAVARYECRLGLGLDLLLNAGWEMRADFNLDWQPGRLRNELRLEAGKCF